MAMPISQESGPLEAFYPKYGSITFYTLVDEELGKAQSENGGHVEMHFCFEGERRPRWWEITKRFLSYKKRVIN